MCSAGQIGSLPPRALSPPPAEAMGEAAGPSTWATDSLELNVAFVYTTLLSSAFYRGQLIAERLGRGALHTQCRFFSSPEANRTHFDVVIHLKNVCHAALAVGKHHVLDHIDIRYQQFGGGLNGFMRVSNRFTGEIMSSNSEVDTLCRSPVCTVIPHHFNLPCASRSTDDRRSNVAVGLIGWMDSHTELHRTLTRAGFHVIDEPRPADRGERARVFASTSGTRASSRSVVALRQQTCDFYNNLSAAVAWSEPDNMFEPAQRFTNPIFLGVPTIGYAYQASFNEWNASSFLCANLDCVVHKLHGIQGRELDSAFTNVRAGVVSRVGWPETRKRYLQLFADVTSCTIWHGSCTVSPVRRDMDGSLRENPLLHHRTNGASAPRILWPEIVSSALGRRVTLSR